MLLKMDMNRLTRGFVKGSVFGLSLFLFCFSRKVKYKDLVFNFFWKMLYDFTNFFGFC